MVKAFVERRMLSCLAALVTLLLSAATIANIAHCQDPFIPLLPPEEKTIKVRDPLSTPPARIPLIPEPATVTNPQWEEDVRPLGLDEAIRVTLSNSDVIRVLAGIVATPSGSTIY